MKYVNNKVFKTKGSQLLHSSGWGSSKKVRGKVQVIPFGQQWPTVSHVLILCRYNTHHHSHEHHSGLTNTPSKQTLHTQVHSSIRSSKGFREGHLPLQASRCDTCTPTSPAALPHTIPIHTTINMTCLHVTRPLTTAERLCLLRQLLQGCKDGKTQG